MRYNAKLVSWLTVLLCGQGRILGLLGSEFLTIHMRISIVSALCLLIRRSIHTESFINISLILDLQCLTVDLHCLKAGLQYLMDGLQCFIAYST